MKKELFQQNRSTRRSATVRMWFRIDWGLGLFDELPRVEVFTNAYPVSKNWK